MPFFTKKPVKIEARRFTEDDYEDITSWCGAIVNGIDDDGAEYQRARPIIRTLEGDLLIEPGDWVIKGVKGEFYPCKPDIFEETYDEA